MSEDVAGAALDRRALVQWLGGLTLAAALPLGIARAAAQGGGDALPPFVPPAGPRARVIYLNDLSGDIDGLFATVHFLLSPSVELRAIIGTGPNQFDPPGNSAATATAIGRTILEKMGWAGRVPVLEGATGNLAAPVRPLRSPGVDAIVLEAMRKDTDLPLYLAVGGGLTEVASALLLEPAIAQRCTLVWIGGGRPHPEWAPLEPNFSIDPAAAQHVFNETAVPIWHVPSEVYQTCIMSTAELQAYGVPGSRIGHWLYDRIIATSEGYRPSFNPGATWTLGDNPLIVLTALNDWVPGTRQGEQGPFTYQRTGSSTFVEERAPRLDERGRATPRSDGRMIRRYTSIDNRLMMADFFAKLSTNG